MQSCGIHEAVVGQGLSSLLKPYMWSFQQSERVATYSPFGKILHLHQWKYITRIQKFNGYSQILALYRSMTNKSLVLAPMARSARQSVGSYPVLLNYSMTPYSRTMTQELATSSQSFFKSASFSAPSNTTTLSSIWALPLILSHEGQFSSWS